MASCKILVAIFVLGVAFASGQMPGAPREMSQAEIDGDSDLQAAVRFAVDEYNAGTDSSFIDTKIVSATVQVVAGLKYVVNVEMQSTQDDEINLTTKCTFEVLFQAWMQSKYTVISSKCLR